MLSHWLKVRIHSMLHFHQKLPNKFSRGENEILFIEYLQISAVFASFEADFAVLDKTFPENSYDVSNLWWKDWSLPWILVRIEGILSRSLEIPLWYLMEKEIEEKVVLCGLIWTNPPFIGQWFIPGEKLPLCIELSGCTCPVEAKPNFVEGFTSIRDMWTARGVNGDRFNGFFVGPNNGTRAVR